MLKICKGTRVIVNKPDDEFDEPPIWVRAMDCFVGKEFVVSGMLYSDCVFLESPCGDDWGCVETSTGMTINMVNVSDFVFHIDWLTPVTEFDEAYEVDSGVLDQFLNEWR